MLASLLKGQFGLISDQVMAMNMVVTRGSNEQVRVRIAARGDRCASPGDRRRDRACEGEPRREGSSGHSGRDRLTIRCATLASASRNVVSGKVLHCRGVRPARCVTLSRPVLFRGWTPNESASAASRALLPTLPEKGYRMPVPPRLRRLTIAALPVLAAVALTACNNAAYPNSIFHSHTEFNREVDGLWKILIVLGTVVFIFVEGAPALRDLPLSAAERERSTRARARQHDARDPVDGHSGPHSRVHRRPDRPHDLQDAGEGEGRRAPGRGDRPSVVVGVPLSRSTRSRRRTSCTCRSAAR